MKALNLLTIGLSLILTACLPHAETSKSKSTPKFVLSAFNGFYKASSLDLNTLSDLPPQVDLKSIMTAARNQDERGTCSFFATIALFEAAIKKELQVETNLSEEYIISYAKKVNYLGKTIPERWGESSNLSVNLQYITKNSGLLLESDWSYQPLWFKTGLPCGDIEKNKQAPVHCFSHYEAPSDILSRVIPGENFEIKKDFKTTNDIIRHLATEQTPVAVMIDLNTNGWPNSGNVTYDDFHKYECEENPDLCGAHYVVLTGYDMEEKVFSFKNSWGKDWGNNGFGTIPFDYIDNHANDIASVKVSKAFTLPEENKQEVKLQNFQLESRLNDDQSVSIKVQALLEGIKGKTIYVSSFPVLIQKGYAGEANDLNTMLHGYKSVFFHLPNKADGEISLDSFTWDEQNPITLQIPNEIMNSPGIKEILEQGYYEVMIRTSIYYSSDDGYQQLGRIYHRLNSL